MLIKTRYEYGKFILTVTIPVNSSATVYVPSNAETLVVNGKAVDNMEKVIVEGFDFHFLKIKKGSGKYTFVSSYTQ